jgi:uncharacterized protein
MNFWIIFLTGLTTGGLTCLAVQGGLLASVIANQKGLEAAQTKKGFDQMDWLPVTLFLVAKLAAHTVLGFLLGWFGSMFKLSLEMSLLFQVLTAVYMFATAMHLLDVHPLFRYVVFQPPKFLQKMVVKSSKSKQLFAPILLGLMTVFIPCGVTQAMEVVAINSGNPFLGALTLFAFVLGTFPLFGLLGVATSRLSEAWSVRFSQVAATILTLMAVYTINGALLVLNFPITVGTFTKPITTFFSSERFVKTQSAEIVNGQQEVSIGIFNNGYQPRNITVKKGIPVKLTLQSQDAYSCAVAFVFKEFGIKTFLGPTDTKSFTFTPEKTGEFTFTCSMGMYTGTMKVI